MRIAIATVVALFALAAPAAAQTPAPFKIGCVDLGYIAAKSKHGQDAAARVENLTKKKEIELLSRAQVLKAEEGKPTFAKAQLEFNRFREDAQSEVRQFAENVEAELRARLFPIVEQLSREKGLDVVFSADSPGLIWFSAAVDLSKEIVERLDKPQ